MVARPSRRDDRDGVGVAPFHIPRERSPSTHRSVRAWRRSDPVLDVNGRWWRPVGTVAIRSSARKLERRPAARASHRAGRRAVEHVVAPFERCFQACVLVRAGRFALPADYKLLRPASKNTTTPFHCCTHRQINRGGLPAARPSAAEQRGRVFWAFAAPRRDARCAGGSDTFNLPRLVSGRVRELTDR
jgi:hypothetical protein